jgi:hypothetical protein
MREVYLRENERYMKQVSQKKKDALRDEYKLSDFPNGIERGKYAKSIRKSSNIVVLKPEVADAFPNEEAVNNALLSLIDLAHKTTRISKPSVRKSKKSGTG